MKKIFLYIAITLGLLSCNHKDSLWQEVVEDLDERVETLEMLCAEMNTNITSLQTIVDVLQSNDFITSIVEIKKDGKVVGYTITFGKHDPITIYHGQDGKDGQNGQNGADGKDGSTPVIGVAQDTDGVYYWTLNGEWLLDDNGNKLPVSGKDGQNGTNGSNGQDGADGKDGQDGEDGKDGADGQDGKDGITPQLKIEDGYWYISYDNGITWTQLGKATGEDGQDGKDGADGADGKDGQNGADGKDGQDGDSFFKSVTQDENYVYFTLADGTIIKIPKGNGSQSSMGDGYVTSGMADGYYYVDLDLPSGTKWATCNVGSNRPEGPGYFFAWGETTRKESYNESDYTLTISSLPNIIYHTEHDAATVNWSSKWATPTKEQWKELVNWANWTYTTYNNINGWKVSGPNGNSIFIPTLGYKAYTDSYWTGYVLYSSSTRNGNYIYSMYNYKYNYSNTPPAPYDTHPDVEDNSWGLYSSGNGGALREYFKYFYGYPIRPVLVENE